MAAMPVEYRSSVNSQEPFFSPDIAEQVLPTPLQEAIKMTCDIIADVIEKDAPPPKDVSFQMPEAPILDFDRKDQGITSAYFRLTRVQEGKVPTIQPKTTFEIGLVHGSDKPNMVELQSLVRAEQTRIYDHPKGDALEISRIIFTAPIRLPEEGGNPVFDMSVVKTNENAQKDFRNELANDINESYPYIVKAEDFLNTLRKNRMQGILRKSPEAA